MPDTYTTKKITDLTANTSVADSDLFVVGNAGTATMRKLSFSYLASAVRDKLTSLTFSGFTTTSKTIPGAINELNAHDTQYIYTGLGSLTANANGAIAETVNVSSSIPTGYTLKAAIPFSTGSYGYYYYYCGRASDTTVTVQLFRVSGSATSTSPAVILVCAK